MQVTGKKMEATHSVVTDYVEVAPWVMSPFSTDSQQVLRYAMFTPEDLVQAVWL